jgi:hypothetical protein
VERVASRARARLPQEGHAATRVEHAFAPPHLELDLDLGNTRARLKQVLGSSPLSLHTQSLRSALASPIAHVTHTRTPPSSH